MPNPSILQPWTLLTNEGALASTVALPELPAGENLALLVHCVFYNGAGNTTTPSTVAADSVNAQLIVKSPANQPRVGESLHVFFAADFAKISAKILTTSGGAGAQKSVEILILQNVKQQVPANKNGGYAAATGTLNIPLTRANDSLTIATGFTSVSGTSLVFANPARSSITALAARRISQGYQNDVNGTSDFVVNGSAYTSALVVNFTSPTAYSITAADNPTIGQSSAITVMGFSSAIDRATVDGVAAVAATNNVITLRGLIDGQLCPRAGLARLITAGNATETGTISRTVNTPPGLVAVEVVAGFKTGEADSIAYQFNPPLQVGDLFYNDPTKGTIGSDAGYQGNHIGEQIIWHHEAATKIVRSFILITGEQGQVISIRRFFGAVYMAADYFQAKKLKASGF